MRDGGIRCIQTTTKRTIFLQGDVANTVFYIQAGKIKLTVVSAAGKEAIIGILEPGSFFGEACLTGQVMRLGTASTTGPATIVAIDKPTMVRVLHDTPVFAEQFLAYTLTRNLRIESDLADQLFNSSEKRLARTLLLLANVGNDRTREPIALHVSQDMLAKIVGTTRPRINLFMKKFTKLGFIDTDHGLHIHQSLINILLRD